MDQDKTGKFIASLRKEKNMTQEQFAEALGVNSRSVSRWETGRCMPDLSLIEAVSDQLGISVSEFLHGSRMNKEEIVAVQDSISTIIEISEKEKKVKAKKLVPFCFGNDVLGHHSSESSFGFIFRIQRMSMILLLER